MIDPRQRNKVQYASDRVHAAKGQNINKTDTGNSTRNCKAEKTEAGKKMN
jgi:hypothetical protein